MFSSVMGLTNGIILQQFDDATTAASALSPVTTVVTNLHSSSPASSTSSVTSSSVVSGASVGQDPSSSLWVNNSLSTLLTAAANGASIGSGDPEGQLSTSSLESMVKSTLADPNKSATILSTLSTITFSPFSTSTLSSFSSSSSSSTSTLASSTSSSNLNLISPEAFIATTSTNATTEASKSIYLSEPVTSSSLPSSIVNFTGQYLDRSNTTLVNFYRTLINPINEYISNDTSVPTAAITTTTQSTTNPFNYESLLDSVNDTSNDNGNIQSDSIASVLPIASPLSLLSSLSIPSSSSSSSSSYNAIPSGELINLNESLSLLSSSSSSSTSSFSYLNNSNISLGNWLESSLFSPTATGTSTLYSLNSLVNINGNSNNSFNNNPELNANTNLDNLISFWESIPYPKSGYTQLAIILLAFFITIIMIVIVVGNLLVCIAITTEKSLKTVQNWFIASLAVSDLLLGLVIMPFSLAYELMGYWIFGALWCDIHHALDVLLCTASINNLCLISLDRYWSVTQAVKYLKKRTPSRAIFMICFVWIFSALVSLPPLVGWKNESIEPGECELSKDPGYVVYSSMGSFYVPAIVMVFVYAKIFVAARSRARKHVKKRKLLVGSEVTNEHLTKEKSTTTTTCTSMSNPSPPEGREETDDGLETSECAAINSKGTTTPTTVKTCDNYNKSNSNVNDYNNSNTNLMAGNCVNSESLIVSNKINRSAAATTNCDDNNIPLSPCSTPTTLTTPKVTFSPRDTVYGEDNGDCDIHTLQRRECISPISLNCPPPQIIIETANNTINNNGANSVSSARTMATLNCVSLTTVKNNVKNVNCDSNINDNIKESRCSSTCDIVDTKSTHSVNINCSSGSGSTGSGSGTSLSERRCPKLRIDIDDSIHNYSTRTQSTNFNNHHHHHSHSHNIDHLPSTNQIVPTSILRSNGYSSSTTSSNPHNTNQQSTGIISETRLTATDDDSDAIDSPISKNSGNFALESKSFLSPSSASLSGFGQGLGSASRFGAGCLVPGSGPGGGSLSGSVIGGQGGLVRSPFGSTMSIADYDDSDLCNDSGDQPDSASLKETNGTCSGLAGSGGGGSSVKKSTKGKGKVQYQTPPVTRRHHTPSDAERHKRKIAKARERRATLILGLIMGSFILAWLPFFVMYLTSGLCKGCQITSGLTFGYWLGYCNSAINPIIYTVFNRDFRKAFRKILFR